MKQSPRNRILSPTSNQTYLFQMTEETAVSPCLGSLKVFVRRTTYAAPHYVQWIYVVLEIDVGGVRKIAHTALD